MDWTYEEVVLGALDGQVRLEEREPDEQCRGAVEGDLRDQVRRVAPVRLAVALEKQRDLVCPRGRKLVLLLGFDGRAVASVGVDLLDLVLKGVILRRTKPRVVPIDRRGRRGAGSDSREDVLSPIRLLAFKPRRRHTANN